LIDDLFQMAQLDAGGIKFSREPASLTDLVSDTIESFSELAARQDVSLSGLVDEDVDPVVMDTQRIGRVLNNLVGNALRHTPSGGQVSLVARRTGPNVEMTVQDSGGGIHPEDLPHIFERFYRGEKSRSRSTGGAGLGLAIAQGIVRAHGGDIRAENNGGARFVITLPA
jgi:signal transduction histidine kinase